VSTVAALLEASGLPLLEARALLAHELACARATLVAHPEREVDPDRTRGFELLVGRRRAGEPLAYLLGEREFYSRSFAVNASVLVPRPETELLVQVALQHAAALRSPRVLDLGTGSGCIAITLALEHPDADVWATDISGAALEVAHLNARRLDAPVSFLQSGWYSAIEGGFDLIVANPPYVAPVDPHLVELRFEPALALVAADNGLACLRQIIAGAPGFLRPGGWLTVEHGFDQGAAVRQMFVEAGLSSVATERDAAQLDRVTAGTLASEARRTSAR
jgi:release factor glutamine methyltransferase